MYVSEFDSVALLGGVEVAVSQPTVYLCRAHQHLYQAHVETDTCSDIDCGDRGFANVTKEGHPITECVQHMKSRLQQEGVGEGMYQTSEDNLSVASSKEPSLPVKPKKLKRVSRESSHSESPDLVCGEERNDTPSLAKQLSDVNAVNLSRPKSTQD